MPDPKDWTPSLPLRHDATEEQIFARELWLKAQVVGTPKPQQWLRVVREFASACVEASQSAPLGSGMASEQAEQLWRWCYSLMLYAGKMALAIDNADNREAGTPNNWPAQQEWKEMASSSHSIFMRRVREMTGIPHDEFLAYVRGAHGERFADIASAMYDAACDPAHPFRIADSIPSPPSAGQDFK